MFRCVGVKAKNYTYCTFSQVPFQAVDVVVHLLSIVDEEIKEPLSLGRCCVLASTSTQCDSAFGHC